MKISTSLVLTAVVACWLAAPAEAQPLGTFRWQLQPYCNVITLTVVQQGGQYQLDGTDNHCGAMQAGSAVGLAFFNPNGSIGFGLTVVTAPGGTPVHVEATIDTSLSGTWRDSAGNSGTFAFTPAGIVPGLPPRPVPAGGLPPGSVTTTQIAPAAVTNTQLATNAVTGANVVDGSLTTADLLGSPRAGFASGDQSVTLAGADSVVRSVSLSIPTAGTVIVNAAGYFALNSAAFDGGRCSITTGITVDFTHLIIGADEGAVTFTGFLPFGGTRGFAVAAGAFTVNLICDLAVGAVDIRDSSLTAIYVGG